MFYHPSRRGNRLAESRCYPRHGHPLSFCPPMDEPPATAPIYATKWSPALPQNTIPELNEALGITAQVFHACEGELHLPVTVLESLFKVPRPVMMWIHGSSYAFGEGSHRVRRAHAIA